MIFSNQLEVLIISEINKNGENSINTNRKNPYNICIWKDVSTCNDCSIKGELQCHEDFRYSIWFASGFIFGFIPAILGIFLGFFSESLNLPLFIISLGGWILYLVIFFIIWEPRMLCSHCPYYAEGEAKVVHCYANHGIPKTTSFNPAPMSRSEKIQFIIGLLIFFGYPIPFLIIAEQFVLLLISMIGVIFWILILQLKICPDCVNFSCPLNRVPKNILVSFIKHNPIMKEAWEKSGYRFE